VPIATFRALREKMANMFVKAYVLESMAYRTAGAMDAAIEQIDKSQPDATDKVVKAIEEYAVEASIMKIWGSEALDYAVDEGVQIHGGYGYSQEYAIEGAYRDSRINRLFEGTNEINRLLIPGTILKRSMKGEVPLMPFAAKLEKELAEGGPKAAGDGPLAAEVLVSEQVKRATVYACAKAIKRYMMELSKPERQMVLMAMADMIMEVYGLDSAVSRALQYVDERGADRAAIPMLLTRIHAAETADFVRSSACRLLSNCLEGGELERAVAAVGKILPFVAVPTYELKDRVAAHLIEREAYNLE
jgi:alkylation response protein AidB-like acyl-CoA dehydrogenase